MMGAVDEHAALGGVGAEVREDGAKLPRDEGRRRDSPRPGRPTEFCAVTAVMTDMPNTRKARKVLRSAWMPAPPPESEPAMVSALGISMAS